MTEKQIYSCANCKKHGCSERDEDQYPDFCPTASADAALLDELLGIYKDNEKIGELARVSACIESEFYGRYTRVEETVEFIKRMGYKKVGIASCVGLLAETNIFTRILRAHCIECYAVGCKIGAVDKTEIGLPEDKKMNGGCGHESMCNPVMQAKVLEEEGTEFNIVIGLCVGHDTLFLMHSKAPATVMIVKDRVLQHNPAAALYGAAGSYSRFKKELKI